MITLIYISIFSAIIALYLLARGLIAIKNANRNELSLKLASSKPIFYDFHVHVFIPFVNFLKISVLPKIFKEFEIIISKFRIIVLKVERRLFHLVTYIRGKREIRNNNSGSHLYWDNVNDSKNGTNDKTK